MTNEMSINEIDAALANGESIPAERIAEGGEEIRHALALVSRGEAKWVDTYKDGVADAKGRRNRTWTLALARA